MKKAIRYYPAVLTLAESEYIRRDAVIRSILQQPIKDIVATYKDEIEPKLAALKLKDSGTIVITCTLSADIQLSPLEVHCILAYYNVMLFEVSCIIDTWLD